MLWDCTVNNKIGEIIVQQDLEACKARLKELKKDFDETNVKMVQECIMLNKRIAILSGNVSPGGKIASENVYECKSRK